MTHPLKTTALAALMSAALAAPLAVQAADASKAPAGAMTTSSERAAAADMAKGHDELAQKLMKGHTVPQIQKALKDMGYMITAMNDREKDYTELEVVKGRQTYEVQIDVDAATGKSTKVDIAPNLWRADATKAAMRGQTVAMTHNGDYSDRTRMPAWTAEKDKLEKTLGTGHTAPQYRAQLQGLGYQITSVNDREKDYIEYEIVKGGNSYEVQIDLDKAGKGSKVDVTTNVWESDATERALGQR